MVQAALSQVRCGLTQSCQPDAPLRSALILRRLSLTTRSPFCRVSRLPGTRPRSEYAPENGPRIYALSNTEDDTPGRHDDDDGQSVVGDKA